MHFFAEPVVRNAHAPVVADDVFGRKTERIALVQKNFALFKSFYSEFGTFCVQHDGKRDVLFCTDFLDGFDFFGVFRVRTVGKVQPYDVHPRVRHGGNDLFGRTGRS